MPSVGIHHVPVVRNVKFVHEKCFVQLLFFDSFLSGKPSGITALYSCTFYSWLQPSVPVLDGYFSLPGVPVAFQFGIECEIETGLVCLWLSGFQRHNYLLSLVDSVSVLSLMMNRKFRSLICKHGAINRIWRICCHIAVERGKRQRRVIERCEVFDNLAPNTIALSYRWQKKKWTPWAV